MAERTWGVDDPAGRDVVQSLLRGLAVVRAFDAEHAALTLDQVAERAAVSRSAARRLLRTLMAADLVTFDGRHFRLSSRLLDLGYAQQSRLSFADVAQPHCAQLAAASGCAVSVGRLDGNHVVYVAWVGAPRLMSISLGVGTRLPAHVPAIGRVQIAYLEKRALSDYLDRAYADIPLRTAVSVDSFRNELAEIRDRGWSYVAEEIDAGLSAIAAPIVDRSGQVVAGIALSTHSDGRAGEQRLVDLIPDLVNASSRIGADLHASHLS
jgi:IclR family pca regulon transcriptional regulator